MSFELIRRKEGEKSENQEIRHKNVQVSINDWGHLVIREFDYSLVVKKCELGQENCLKENAKYDCLNCEHYKTQNIPTEEHLIVFDKATTEKIIAFVFSIRSTFEFKQLLKDMINKSINGMPF